MFVMFATAAPACTPAPRQPAPAREAQADPELQKLRAALGEIPVNAGATDPSVTALQHRFADFYRARPAAALSALSLVREERAARGKIVLDALALAHTPDSAAALSAIASDAATPEGARTYARTCMARPLWTVK